MTQERTEAQIPQQSKQLDITPLLTDVESMRSGMDAKQYGLLLNSKGGDTTSSLPDLTITKSGNDEVARLDAKAGDAKAGDAKAADAKAKPSDLDLIEIEEPKPTDTKVASKEKLGGTDVYKNQDGEVIGIHRMDHNGKDEFWRKGPDGKWTIDTEYKSNQMDSISNVTVDKNGDIHYRIEDQKVSVVDSKDAVKRATSDETGATTTYERNEGVLRPTETTDGKGHGRKFHYDKDNKVDQIDGHLGHWDRRTNANGETEWVNRDSKAVWKGEFEVKSNGDLIFKGQNGVTWKFTKEGKDELQPRKSS